MTTTLHSFSSDLAQDYGVKCALLYQIISDIYKKSIKDGNFVCYENDNWVPMPVDMLNKVIPYMSDKLIRKNLIKLEDEGLIKSSYASHRCIKHYSI